MISRCRAGPLAVAGMCLAAAILLAWQHPLAPWPALAAVLAWSAFVARWPTAWLWAVPAALPFLNFAPWTGGLIVEEFDFMVLGTAAGLYASLARGPAAQPPGAPNPGYGRSVFVGAALLFGAASAVSLVRGVTAAGGFTSFANGWFQGYMDPLNSWRVFKSVAWAALLWRPLRQAIRADAEATVRLFIGGALAGLLVVLVAVVWERAAYPGLWEFSGRYRTTALFWEMHVGGGAIDVYLALAAPLVAWALWSAKSPGWWCAAAALALLAAYACLTTFSRGVYLAVAAPLTLLGVLLASQRIGGRVQAFVRRSLAVGAVLLVVAITLAFAFETGGYVAGGLASLFLAAVAVALRRWVWPVGWRTAASLALALALLLEVVAVLGLGTFMRERLAASDSDFNSRLLHWKDGLRMMRSGSDWLWGIGTGRLPAGYATEVEGVELPGDLKFLPGSAQHGSVLLLGPKTRSDIPGLLSLNQRIALRPGRAYRADFDIRVVVRSVLYLRVCEMHLLYARECQTRVFSLGPDPTTPWRHLSVPLQGRSLTAGEPAWPRRAVFMVAVVNAGGVAELSTLGLQGPDGAELLSNGDFSHGLANWLPTAQGYFVPWHVDNLYLELLVERGLPALLTFLVCFAVVLWRLLAVPARATPAAPFLLASLCAALCAGTVDSIMDVPRVAFLLFLIAILGAELTFRPGVFDSPA